MGDGCEMLMDASLGAIAGSDIFRVFAFVGVGVPGQIRSPV